MRDIKCPKCAGIIKLDTEIKFIKCAHCSSQIYINHSGPIYYQIIPFELSENDAADAFRAWINNSTKIRDLDALTDIIIANKKYFPIYIFKRDIGDKEERIVKPAKSTILHGPRQLNVLGIDPKSLGDDLDSDEAEIIHPDISMNYYLTSLPGKSKEQTLAFFPIWELEYRYQDKIYTAIVDAYSSDVFTSELPTRDPIRYMSLAIGGFIALTVEGFLTTMNMAAGISLMAITIAAIFATSFIMTRRA